MQRRPRRLVAAGGLLRLAGGVDVGGVDEVDPDAGASQGAKVHALLLVLGAPASAGAVLSGFGTAFAADVGGVRRRGPAGEEVEHLL